MEGKKDSNKPLNEIRIGFQSRVRNIVNYATILLKENNFRSLTLSAIGGAIGSLINAVEVLKINIPGLYQVNTIGTVSYQTIDQGGDVDNKRLYPKFEVLLTMDAPTEKSEGFQEKLSEEERIQLQSLARERTERPQVQEGEFRGSRGRGDFRPRGFRGSRGGSRGGFRGGFRGPREDFRGPREEFREESRGGYREEPREEFREESRGGYREEPREDFRGGFRGAPRGGFRGAPRGGFRGAPRGGFRGAPRGGFRGAPRGGFRGGFEGNRDAPRIYRGKGEY